jgi:leader peptidase (prepilin peptidase)/N-methyltransferase
MEILHALQQHFWLFLLLVALIALAVGSFLNVVIYRLPLMLIRYWQTECKNLQQEAFPKLPNLEKFNLLLPHSHCPHCQAMIKPWQNIPIFSFIVLRGRAACCQSKISWRYPLVETLTLLLTLITAYQFGFGWQAVCAILLTWALLALSFIDLDHQLLPDAITLPVLWLGLCVNLWHVFAPLSDAVIGAIAGYVVLWSFTTFFKLLTGKIGMGHGDFKLTAMLGAWLGWQMLPLIIFASALLGALIGISMIVLRRHQYQKPLPYGPYIALAGWIALLWGSEINQYYLQTILGY